MGTFISELPEDAEVVLPEQPERRQAVAEHGHPLEAHAEREAVHSSGSSPTNSKSVGSTMPDPAISIQPE